MENFKSNVELSFNNVKKDIRKLESHIANLQKANSELKKSISTIKIKNEKLNERVKKTTTKVTTKTTKAKKVKKSSKSTKKIAKKSASRDANLVACNQEHEMAQVLKHFKKTNSKENRAKMSVLCKNFKNNKSAGKNNRENFYKYIQKLSTFKQIK
ncbi:hypothetical protein K9L67_00210 [Candidatus Woesearchaeota archaeon]|nr:hypothetical protein [Candidatus Woesearchaeota archaeon]MCF7900629.1 hypothetical protein [Candidatus Woesearchaeota archaeon]MCF8013469.1 hypothetical protein [Candidatus Woesearchaeota archaeon]